MTTATSSQPSAVESATHFWFGAAAGNWRSRVLAGTAPDARSPLSDGRPRRRGLVRSACCRISRLFLWPIWTPTTVWRRRQGPPAVPEPPMPRRCLDGMPAAGAWAGGAVAQAWPRSFPLIARAVGRRGSQHGTARMGSDAGRIGGCVRVRRNRRLACCLDTAGGQLPAAGRERQMTTAKRSGRARGEAGLGPGRHQQCGRHRHGSRQFLRKRTGQGQPARDRRQLAAPRAIAAGRMQRTPRVCTRQNPLLRLGLSDEPA